MEMQTNVYYEADERVYWDADELVFRSRRAYIAMSTDFYYNVKVKRNKI